MQYTVLCAGHVVVYTHAPCHTLSLTSCNVALIVEPKFMCKSPLSPSTVKLINKARKKEYRVEKLGSTPFNSLKSINAALKDQGGNMNNGIGYTLPGHGPKVAKVST